ncbi:MAG: zinc-dependent alcohol dehydrogenase family protein [Verrucomicrobia bacterium]|nr:zinc-dependent alcohol dehydrogenase family protein [Verrucomicrobiota bacterium]MDE3098966.1 zinc-dependent alcohol dehydrogenase family protein [Verrucomicrobiota bacterium]
MRAMVLVQPNTPLRALEIPAPRPAANEILIHVGACAVCRTDLHIVDGELPRPKLPLVPGHEIVGRVVAGGRGARRFKLGSRVGVPWLGRTCGTCPFCRGGRENLCDKAEFTGYTRNGGYAEFVAADERFCFPIPNIYSDAEAAPLLCAGLIGFRSLAKTGNARKLGIYGFGAAAHIITQVAVFQKRKVFAFTRRRDSAAQRFAISLGAVWSGHSEMLPPEKLDAAILFAPVGALVPQALKALEKGGTVVCGGIHMSNVPQFSYDLLWQERSISSVANLTRQDGMDFFKMAPRVPVKTSVQTFPLCQANTVLDRLRNGKIHGAAVLAP